MSQADTKFVPSLEVSTEMLIKLIPDFDTAQPTQVYRYIRSCDSAFRVSSVSQHAILLTFALNKIFGPGASDLHSKDFPSWADLKAYLIQKFSQTKTLGHLNLELQSMFQKPNESITDYYLRVDLCRSKILEKIAAEINDLTKEGRIADTEETALNVFVNGLSSDIGTMLRVHSYKNLRDAGNFAIQEEKIRNMNAARQRLYKNISSSPSIQPRKPTPVANQNQLMPNISQGNNKTCNYCKKPGHEISECRKRAYNNSRLKNPPIPKSQPSNSSQTRVNHLNSQAAEELSNSPGTASVLFSNYPMTSNAEDLTKDLDSLQIQ